MPRAGCGLPVTMKVMSGRCDQDNVRPALRAEILSKHSSMRWLGALVAGVTLLACVPLEDASAATASSNKKRLVAAFVATERNLSSAGFDVEVRFDTTQQAVVRRKGASAGFYQGKTLVAVSTPTSLYRRSVDEVSSPVVEQVKNGDYDWVRYRQFTPAALPTLSMLTIFDELTIAKPVVKISGATTTYSFKEAKPSRTYRVVTSKDKKTGIELVTSVTVTGSTAAIAKRLQRVTHTSASTTGGAPYAVTGTGPSIIFKIGRAQSGVIIPTGVKVFDTTRSNFDVSQYGEQLLEDFARDILFAANRRAELVNTSVTSEHLNRVLAERIPYEYQGVFMRSVDAKLELTVGWDSPRLYCAQLVRFDYTKESMVFLESSC